MEIDKSIVLHLISLSFLFTFLLLSVTKKNKLLQKQSLFFLLVITCYYVFIQRDYSNTAIDLLPYKRHYESIISFYDVFFSKFSWKGDYFFYGLMPIGHFFGLSSNQFITFETILSVSLLFLAYKRFFENQKTLIYLGLFFVINSSSFYFIYGNVLRQGLASSILLLSLSYKGSSKMPRFLYKATATLVHRASFLSFFSWFVPTKRQSRIFLLIVALLTGYFSLYILLSIPLPEYYENKLRFYAEFQRASKNSIIKLIILIFFNIIFIFYANHKTKKYERTYKLFYVYSLFAFLFFRLDGMFSRLVLFSDIFIPILTIGMIYKIPNKKERFIALVLIIIISFLYSFYVYNHPSISVNLGKTITFFES